MKRHNLICKILIFTLIIGFIHPVFSEDTTPAPYDKTEFPQGLKDLRRFEIITLGAMPFVTLNTTLIYSGYRYVQSDYNEEFTPNLFGASSYSSNEQKNIILTSLAVCVGIGLTDYFIRLYKRNKAKKVQKLLTYDDISIYPLSEDPEAQLVTSPSRVPNLLPETSDEEAESVILVESDVEEVEE